MRDGASADAFVAIGSNIAPEENIPRAVIALHRVCEVVAASTFYVTQPVERPGDPDYRNGAVHVRTETPPSDFQYRDLRGVERDLGRVRTADRYAARTIDLDLVLYGDSAGDFGGLRLPALDLFERNFVALPVAELAPEFRVPEAGMSLHDLADRFRDSELVIDYALTERVREIVRDE